jgi:CubicO group peptidase (beta-lactamase class C family)
LGLTLAGEIVAAASGQPYEEYIQKNILEPLGLRDTTPFLPE